MTAATAPARPPALERWATGLEVLRISAGTQWADTRTSPFVILLGVVQPTVFLIVALAPQDHPAPAEVARVAFGVLLTSFWASTVWAGAGILRRDRFQGTLGRTLLGVHDPLVVVLGRSLSASLSSALSVAVTVAAVLTVWGRRPDLGGGPLLLAGALVVLASGTAIGLLIGSLFLLTRHGPALSSALMYPVFLLGGMLVPLSLIPSWLRWLSDLISLRWLQEFFVSTSAGAPDVRALLIALALTLGYGVGGVLLFRRVVGIARRQGTLDLV
jgi:ABC-2 type transport system permease protein